MSSSARKPVIFGLIAAVIAVIAVIELTKANDDYKVKVLLSDAGGLKKNSSVKIGGVTGGKVIKLVPTKDDHALATLALKKNAAPVGKNASVRVRPTDLLGERYAELAPGNINNPMPDGGTIPMSRSSEPVEVEDVLNMLDLNTRQRLGILINEAGVAFNGRGANFNKLLSQLPGNLSQVRGLVQQVSNQNVALENAIHKGDRITATINGGRDDLGTMIEQANSTLKIIADKRKDLGHTIESAPGGLGQLRTTLARLQVASQALRPFAGDVQRAAQPLNDTLKEIPDFATAADPTLSKLRDVSPSLTKLGTRATPTVKRAKPTADRLSTVLNEATPTMNQIDKRAVDDILWFMNNWTLGTNDQDGLAHSIGAYLYIDADYITDAANSFTSGGKLATNDDDTATKTRKGTKTPSVPSSIPVTNTLTQQAPTQAPVQQVQDKVKQLPQKLKDKLPPSVKKLTDNLQNATPQVLNKVTSAVNNLLGQPNSGQSGAPKSDQNASGVLNQLLGP